MNTTTTNLEKQNTQLLELEFSEVTKLNPYSYENHLWVFHDPKSSKSVSISHERLPSQ